MPGAPGVPVASAVAFHVLQRDAFSAEDQQAFDHVAQFAYVSGPVLLLQRVEGAAVDLLEGGVQLFADPPEEVADQLGDVRGALAQCRNLDDDTPRRW